MSMSPGRMVLPGRSMRVAPAGIRGRAPPRPTTDTMRPSVITITGSSIMRPASTSTIRSAVTTTEAADAGAAVAVKAAASRILPIIDSPSGCFAGTIGRGPGAASRNRRLPPLLASDALREVAGARGLQPLIESPRRGRTQSRLARRLGLSDPARGVRHRAFEQADRDSVGEVGQFVMDRARAPRTAGFGGDEMRRLSLMHERAQAEPIERAPG